MKQITVKDSYKPSLTQEDISAFEKKLNISLPEDYRKFLLLHNGGYPEPNEFTIEGGKPGYSERLEWFFGIHDGEYNNLMREAELMHDRIPSGLLSIGMDPGGNHILIGVSGPNKNKVYFWDHEEEAEEGESPTYDNVYFIANSFNEFLNSLT